MSKRTSKAIVPLLVAPRMDLSLTNGERYVWLASEPGCDLWLERASEGWFDYDDIPEPPEPEPMVPFGSIQKAPTVYRECWVEYTRQEIGWPEMLQWDGAKGCDEIARCLAEIGAAPGQPFLVHFHSPRTIKASYEYEEYDFWWESEVVYVEPWPAEKAAKAWEFWMADATQAEQENLARIENVEVKA